MKAERKVLREGIRDAREMGGGVTRMSEINGTLCTVCILIRRNQIEGILSGCQITFKFLRPPWVTVVLLGRERHAHSSVIS